MLLALSALSMVIMVVGMAPPGSTLARKKVIIAGAGPAGLLAAHTLLSRYSPDRRDFLYDVMVVEKGADPRGEVAGPRAYSLGLNVRGQAAIRSLDAPGRSFGLWHAVRREGVFSEEFWIHIGKLKLAIRKKAKPGGRLQPPPTLMIPRNRSDLDPNPLTVILTHTVTL